MTIAAVYNHLVIKSKWNKGKTILDLTAELNSSREKSISLWNVKKKKNQLRSAGLRMCIAIKKPVL